MATRPLLTRPKNRLPSRLQPPQRSPPIYSSEPKAARAQKAGTDVESAAPAAAAAAPAAGAVATAAAPSPTGPGGHTQRLLTVVKSGSIQDVKAVPVDKVHVWPHLLVVEFVAALAVTGLYAHLLDFVNAPLLELADFNATPNPSKARGTSWVSRNFSPCSTPWSPV